MELSYSFIQVIQDAVLRPDWGSALALFFLSIANELAAVLPYFAILSGQLVFLQASLSDAMLIKLLIFIAIPVGVGSAAGSLLIYGLAYFGGRPAIDKLQKYFRFSGKDIEKVESKFRGGWYDEVLFLILRSIPFLPSLPVSAVAGILQMPPTPYFALSAVGFTARIMIMFMLVGFGIGTLAW